MATVTRPGRRTPAYLPSQAEIAAATADIRATRQAALDAGEVLPDTEPLKTKTPAEALACDAKIRAATRLRTNRKRAAARAARELPAIEVDAEAEVNALLQQNDQSEPIDLDEHRDPRQTEQWLPVPTVIVPTTVPAAEPNDWATRLEQHRRDDIQACWDARREHRELGADANARGVLSYYNINRGPRMPYHDRANDEQFDMADRDIANVELLEFGKVDEALGMMIDAVEAQHEMEDLNCRWAIADVEPTQQTDVPPFKSATAWERRDVVAFRSKRK